MNIEIVQTSILLEAVRRLAQESYGDMVKAVADLGKNIIAVGGEMHADAQAALLDAGSKQEDLWGFNIFPDNPADKKLVYTSLINIRPRQNRQQLIESPEIREAIQAVVRERIPELQI